MYSKIIGHIQQQQAHVLSFWVIPAPARRHKLREGALHLLAVLATEHVIEIERVPARSLGRNKACRNAFRWDLIFDF